MDSEGRRRRSAMPTTDGLSPRPKPASHDMWPRSCPRLRAVLAARTLHRQHRSKHSRHACSDLRSQRRTTRSGLAPFRRAVIPCSAARARRQPCSPSTMDRSAICLLQPTAMRTRSPCGSRSATSRSLSTPAPIATTRAKLCEMPSAHRGSQHADACAAPRQAAPQACSIGPRRHKDIALLAENGPIARVVAEHDGYLARFGLKHRRTVAFDGISKITISDELIGDFGEAEVDHLLPARPVPAQRRSRSAGSILIAAGGRPLARMTIAAR